MTTNFPEFLSSVGKGFLDESEALKLLHQLKKIFNILSMILIFINGKHLTVILLRSKIQISYKNNPGAYRMKRFFFLILFIPALFSFAAQTEAQTIVDKTVATVGDGVGVPELITYSDLLWQLAIQPNVPLTPPTSEDLNRALQLLINQRLFALEAKRLPRSRTTDAEIQEKIKDVLAQFSSTAEFESRLRLVGFDSVRDENFLDIMRQRVAIDKYLDFRFRSFIVITQEDEMKYYRDVYTPDFRRRNPGLLLPAFDEVRVQINQALSEDRVALEIERFLDEAKRRSEIVVLSEV